MPIDPLSPITSAEFIEWVTEVEKSRKRAIVEVDASRKKAIRTTFLVASVFVAFLSIVTVFEVQSIRYATSQELKNKDNVMSKLIETQKQVASIRAIRTAAVTKNEISLCRIVFTLVNRQQRAMDLLVLVAMKEGVDDEKSRKALKQLSVEVHDVKSPSCDGFPRSPYPWQ